MGIHAAMSMSGDHCDALANTSLEVLQFGGAVAAAWGGSYLGRFPLVSAHFWTSDHLSERSRRVDAFSETVARGTLMLKRP